MSGHRAISARRGRTLIAWAGAALGAAGFAIGLWAAVFIAAYYGIPLR